MWAIEITTMHGATLDTPLVWIFRTQSLAREFARQWRRHPRLRAMIDDDPEGLIREVDYIEGRGDIELALRDIKEALGDEREGI